MTDELERRVLMNRRSLLRGAGALSLLSPLAAAPAWSRAGQAAQTGPTSKTVSFRNDLVPKSGAQAMAELTQLVAAATRPEDQYLQGGAVAELEARVATLFGKDAAAFFPTGSMANTIALRVHCPAHERVLVQHDSHLYLDEGDAAAMLGGLNLMPLAAGRAVASVDDFSAAIETSLRGPYAAKVGAIALESPVRRHSGATIPFDTLKGISDLARSNGIRMHWDGARSLLSLGTPGFDLPATAALFDTVYLSLYKYLDAPYGAILAGSKELIDKARQLRHVHGGTIYQGWQCALPALHSLSTFPAQIVLARARFETLLDRLQAAGGFSIERVPGGSSIVFVNIAAERLQSMAERLAAADILVREPEQGRMALTLNLSVLRRSPEQLARAFTG
ncbi:threonine aldolase family protein [Peristeroidobacter soli]|uniref:threonine aldolase family protein n=1 Tax=Peristeroidobacter soli TaxID=2497877 RepID=UPI00101C6E10|nr:beta-eliminating lyase-related protein [Peristeroidobacter soli]